MTLRQFLGILLIALVLGPLVILMILDVGVGWTLVIVGFSLMGTLIVSAGVELLSQP